ncbi:VOC family protein [Rhizobium jaguaris]|uniref:VOC domain-containing protein n=1 Tax=Rhizobium jaguaris TaxID=1312183 RepID=A0A387FXX8_9HYPH|nr:VOC family protein [Rhizobium jaguaris]AYG59976.1 hypothetical protein CCGE525_15020 [Rhizobium jaguaris]
MPTELAFHHVTAVCSDEERTTEFYTAGLGMRLLRRTVNYDQTTMLEIQLGGSLGVPASIITFTVNPASPQGVQGTGQISNLVFIVHAGTLEQWAELLARRDVDVTGFASSFGERCLCFSDPDGLSISLVECDRGGHSAIADKRLAIGKLKSVEFHLQGFEHTARFIREILGFAQVDRQGAVTRFADTTTFGGPVIDLLSAPGHGRGTHGAGVATHVAFKVSDLQRLKMFRDRVVAFGLDVTPVLDRYYFKAIYFEIPCGVRVGLAADTSSGLILDDNPAGPSIVLPPWLETQRSRIERRLGTMRPK